MNKKLIQQYLTSWEDDKKIFATTISDIIQRNPDVYFVCGIEYHVDGDDQMHGILTAFVDREETDEEFTERKETEKLFQNDLKKRRYETYLKLKKEFENES